MATNKRTIVVVGGTGRVGRSVAFSLHDNQDFHVKVTTRDPTTAKARRISSAGIEVVKADSWITEELDAAFSGAWAVFLNIDSDDRYFKDELGRPEFDMGKTVIDAAIRQGVQSFVFASLPRCEELTGGKVDILSFRNKNLIEDYGANAGFGCYANVNIGWQMENFWNPQYEVAFGGFARKRDSEGYLTIKIFKMGNEPESTPWTNLADDYGDIVHGIFLNPERWNGHTVWAISDNLSFQGVADTWNRITGSEDARYVQADGPAAAPTPSKAKEVNGVRSYSHFVKGNYCGGKPVDQSDAKVLKMAATKARRRPSSEGELRTFDSFIREHGIRNEAM